MTPSQEAKALMENSKGILTNSERMQALYGIFALAERPLYVTAEPNGYTGVTVLK